jgi:hypothetical protein
MLLRKVVRLLIRHQNRLFHLLYIPLVGRNCLLKGIFLIILIIHNEFYKTIRVDAFISNDKHD